MRLSDEERARVTAAVVEAERGTDGEIVTIVAEASDAYHDVVLHWAVLAMFLALAVIAAVPGHFTWLLDALAGDWGHEWSATTLLTILMFVLAAKFLVWRYILGIPALRLALTPAATKHRRVRRRAILLFRVAAERRTAARTGVLLYLSLAERRAEIVADSALHGRVAPETWGEAMVALIAAVKDKRPGDGMVGAVERIGAVLAEHVPKTATDVNELPDGVIEL